jgi:hypothetical protein
MAKTKVVCRVEECPDSYPRNKNAPEMQFVKELESGFVFVCRRCQNMRVCTKDQVGGTFGVGQRSDGTGPTGGKGPLKWRPGMDFKGARQ